MNLGPRMRRFRILTGLTQQELAERVGISRAAISLYESSEREPDLRNQKKIATALGVTIGDLLGEGQLQDVPEETVAFARQLESLSADQRAAVMQFIRRTLLT